MKIYGSALSPSYRRACIAAAELGLHPERVVLDIRAGHNKTPEYLAKNPMGKIATLEDDDGWCLWESPAICAYLGEKYPDKGLWPTDLRGRADALRWSFWNASHLEPGVNKLIGERIFKPMRGAAADPHVLEAGMKELGRYLPVLEAHLAKHEWMLGRMSLVDVLVGTTAEYLKHAALEFDLGPTPATGAWLSRLAARPTWMVG
jgi:glutathione S-transferase